MGDSNVGLVCQWGRGCTQEDSKGPESLKARPAAWGLLFSHEPRAHCTATSGHFRLVFSASLWMK